MFNKGSNRKADPQTTAAPAPEGESLLVAGEELVDTVATEQQVVTVTNRRLIISDRTGSWSVVNKDQIAAVQVTPGGREGLFVEIHFGGGLTRTLMVRSVADAQVITAVLGC